MTHPITRHADGCCCPRCDLIEVTEPRRLEPGIHPHPFRVTGSKLVFGPRGDVSFYSLLSDGHGCQAWLYHATGAVYA